MLTKNINFKNFEGKKINKKISNSFKNLTLKKNEILKSLSEDYKDSFKKKNILKFKKYTNITIIGIGGSILGSKCIYNFLKKKIKKKFFFNDNLEIEKFNSKKNLNLIISKSGNTLETITNSNILINNKNPNIFITENKKSYLFNLAQKLKAEIIHHNDFIGGRYSVLSEVGMLPAYLMGLNIKKFRKFNELIKNKKFINSLILNVSNTLNLVNKKRFNSVILNYDLESQDLFYWYQQLIAESLGKKSKGIFPIVSNMPKDNHSLMQLYLDGKKNNFYTFFFFKDFSSKRIKNKYIIGSHKYLKDKKIMDIKYSQYSATLKVFRNRNIPFRTFEIKQKNEETLGELFTFFILETILLAKAMNVNPYDQPSVELIKSATKKILIKN
tara:strand:+ start:2244 stop:3398 length:1155 start_codon:yes stop_codon:yes gene_type:complete